MNTYRVQVPFQRPVYTSHLTRFPAVSTPFHTRFDAISNTLNKRHFTLLPPPFQRVQRRFNAVSTPFQRRFTLFQRRFTPFQPSSLASRGELRGVNEQGTGLESKLASIPLYSPLFPSKRGNNTTHLFPLYPPLGQESGLESVFQRDLRRTFPNEVFAR